MADKTIDELTAGAPAVSSDEIPIWRSGDTYKLALSDLSGVVGAGETLHTVASSTAALTVNYATADVWDITLTANCTITLSGFTNAKPDYLTVVIRQDGTGSRLIIWPAITWIGTGIAPILQTAAGSVDSVVLFSFDGGTTVYGIAQTSASGLKSGTSFPGSPSDGDLFYRTDRRVIYEYNSSVTRWLSLDRKLMSIPDRWLGISTTGFGAGFVPIVEDLYIESWQIVSYISGTNNGSNFYTTTLIKATPADVETTIGSLATSGDTANNFVTHTISVGSVVDAATYATVFLNVAKTGTPGSGRYQGHTLVMRAAG